MSIQERSDLRQRLHQWAERGELSAPALERALALAGVLPSASDWRRFFDWFFLLAGALFLVLGILFFFAFNWADMGRLSKLAVGQGALLLALAGAFWRGLDDLAGKTALLAACILTGVVLAIFGQVYQTGADPWQLFAVWAALILPWAVVGRFAGIWVLWAGLINVAISLYWERWGWFDHKQDVLILVLLAFNLSALLLWEWGQARAIDCLAPRWAPRLLAWVTLSCLTSLALEAIFTHGAYRGALPKALLLTLYPLLLLGLYLLHRLVWRDLFILTLCALSQIVVVTAWLGRILLEQARYFEGGALLLLGLLIIAQSAFWAVMLRRLQQEAQA